MPDSDYLFVHPLLGADSTWAAYRVEAAANGSSNLGRLGDSALLGEFDQRHLWLLPVAEDFRPHEQFGERVVSVFPAQLANSESLRELEARLRQEKRKLALEASPGIKLPAAGAWEYLLIGASHARSLPPYSLIGLASRTTLVATDVNSRSDRDWTLANACTLTTDEFLTMRSSQRDQADITRLKLLEMLALIQEDADTRALEEIFRQESKLSYSLLRLVNSAALAPRNPITSFSQAINLLGRRQLQRWLQLLVYADSNSGQQANPLLLKAAARGRLMEFLADRVAPDLPGNGDMAFMIGTFSLLDVLLDMPMSQILMQLPLPEAPQRALNMHEGPLGVLLSAIDAAEKRDMIGASRHLQHLGLEATAYLEAQLTALTWAGKIRQTA